MAVETVRLVLGEHDDLAQLGVDQVRQGEVDQAVLARRTGPRAWRDRRSAASAASLRHLQGRCRRSSVPAMAHHSRGNPAAVLAFRSCESICSPVNIRRRSTAGPGCTSPSWCGRCGSTPTWSCAASAPRARSPTRSPTGVPAELARRTAPSRRSASTCGWRRTAGGADLVHSHTWYANAAGQLASLLHGMPARRHRAQPRAAPPVEGRTARRRLPRLQLDRDGRRSSRRDRGHRGQRRHAPRHPAQLPVARPRQGDSRLQRHRPRPVEAARGRRPRARRSASTPTGPPSSSSAGSPGRRGCRTCCAPRGCCRRTCRSCCAPARRTPRRSWRRSRAASSAAGGARRGRLDRPPAQPDGAARRCSPHPPSSSARRSTNRSASSTSRRWRAACRSSARRPAASPRSSSTA